MHAEIPSGPAALCALVVLSAAPKLVGESSVHDSWSAKSTALVTVSIKAVKRGRRHCYWHLVAPGYGIVVEMLINP